LWKLRRKSFLIKGDIEQRASVLDFGRLTKCNGFTALGLRKPAGESKALKAFVAKAAIALASPTPSPQSKNWRCLAAPYPLLAAQLVYKSTNCGNLP
jgi:hypothetical protein